MTEKKKIFELILLDGILLVLAVVLINYNDLINFNLQWIGVINRNGLWGIYDNFEVDYPPLFPMWLSIFSPLATNGWKIIMMWTQLILKSFALVILFITQFFLCKKVNYQAAVSWTINLAFLVNTVYWGQLDAAFGLVMILFFYCIKKKYLVRTCLVFAVMCLLKHQGVYFIFPLLLYLGITEEERCKKLKALLLGAAVGIVGWLPFVWHTRDLTLPIKVYLGAFNEYSYYCSGASNFWSFLVDHTIHENIKSISFILLLLCIFITLGFYARTKLFMETCTFYVFSLFMITWNQKERYGLYTTIMFFLFYIVYEKKEYKMMYYVSTFANFLAQIIWLIAVNFSAFYILFPTEEHDYDLMVSISQKILAVRGGVVQIVSVINIVTYIIFIYIVLFRKKNVDKK